MAKTWTTADVRQLLVSLWPDGQLYDWFNPSASIYQFLDAVAEVTKSFGYELLERLRRELDLAGCTDKLPDWEAALGLAATPVALSGDAPARRASILSRLR